MIPRATRPHATIALAGLVLALATAALAQAPAAPLPSATLPAVTVSASATASVANDRMSASLRAETDNADPAAAAGSVNARMAKALARARSVKGVEVSTSGYTSYQITEKNQPPRWRVAQTLQLEGGDFSTLSALVSQLQADGGLTVASINFSVGEATRTKAEDALTQQAIKAWQARAQAAARGFGYESWRVGKAAVQSDAIRPQPMFRAASAMSVSAAPVAIEAGNTDVTVTVTGEALLELQKPLPR
jgi:predicted secreted protein